MTKTSRPRSVHEWKHFGPSRRLAFAFCLLSLAGGLVLTGCGAGALGAIAGALSGGGGGGDSGAPGAAAPSPSSPEGSSPTTEPDLPADPIVQIEAGQVADIVLSPDGSVAYCSDSKAKEIIKIDVKKRIVLDRMKLLFAPTKLAISPGGRMLYALDGASEPQPYVWAIDLERDSWRKMTLPTGGVGIAVDGSRLLISTKSNDFLIKQLPDGPVTVVPDSTLYNVRLLLDRERQKLYTIGYNSWALGRYDVAGSAPMLESSLSPAGSWNYLDLSADGKALLFQTKGHWLREISAENLSQVNGEYYITPSSGNDAAIGVFDPLSPKVWSVRYATGTGWKIFQFDRKLFVPEKVVDITSFAGAGASHWPNILRITPDGSRLVFAYRFGSWQGDDRILLVDTAAAETVPALPNEPGTEGPIQVLFVSDMVVAKAKHPVTSAVDYRLYVADSNGNQILAIDAVSLALLKIYNIGAKPRKLAVNATGDLLAAVLVGSKALAIIRVFEDDVKTIPMPFELDSLHDIAFGPDGDLYVLISTSVAGQPYTGNDLHVMDPVSLTEKTKVKIHAGGMQIDPVAKKLFTSGGYNVYRYDIPSGFVLEKSETIYGGLGLVLSPDWKTFLHYGSSYEYSAETFEQVGYFKNPVPVGATPKFFSLDGAYVYDVRTPSKDLPLSGKPLVAWSRASHKMLWGSGLPLDQYERISASAVSPLGDELFLATYTQKPTGFEPGFIHAVPLPKVQLKGTGLTAKLFDLPADSASISTAVASGFAGYAPGSFSLMRAKSIETELLTTVFPHVHFAPTSSTSPGEFLYWGPNGTLDSTSSAVSGDDVLVIPPGDSDGFGAQFSGVVAVPFPGIYTFKINATGWVNLHVGGSEVISTSGPLTTPTNVAGGLIIDSAGYYPIEINYGQASGNVTLALEGEGPGLPGGIVPEDFFYPAGSSVPPVP